MSETRCAAILGPGGTLAGGLATALGSIGYTVEVIPMPALADSVTEPALADLFPEEVGGLVIGDGVFPPLEDPDEAIRLTLLTSFIAIKTVLRSMMRRRYGRIIAIAPPLSDLSIPHYALRGGLGALLKSVAREVGSRGITANLIAPGHQTGEGTELSPYVALARPGEPEDIARAAAFLMSDASSYITGQVLMVDGGLTTS